LRKKLAGFTLQKAIGGAIVRELSNFDDVSMKRSALLFLLVLAAAGCDETLETGYEPRRLNMSLTREQTLYADQYSQQALQAGKDDNSSSGDSGFHKPGTP
jgi:hypothetical protein